MIIITSWTNRIILIISALFIAGSVTWYFQHEHTEYSRSKAMILDVLRIIRIVADIRNEATKDGFEGVYQFRQLVSDAQHRLKPWLSDANSQRTDITRSVQDMLADLESASNLYLALHDDPSERQLAEFKVKLDSGHMKTIGIAATIVKQEELLSDNDKRAIVDYINLAFGNELADFGATKWNGDVFPEIVAVLVIKRKFEERK